VLTLDKTSVFHENVSWMLQSALSSSGKADSLYEYCDDDDIVAECRRLGLREEDLSLVRLKQSNLKHVKAVGTTGKRSVMLAVVVALALEDGDALGELWKELRDYKLDKPFVDLLHSGRETVSNEAADNGDGPSGSLASDGVDLSVVSQQVPVLGLAKDSIFQENASWLLQTALSSSGRADSLYEYCSDRDILNQCRRLGLSDQDVGIVRLKREDLKGVKAVGTCGKRSIMLSLVVAVVLHDKVQLSVLTKEVAEYDSQLEGPFRALVRSAMRSAGRPVQEEKEEEESWGSWVDGRWNGSWSGKRKWAQEDHGWSHGGYKWSQPSNQSSKKRGGGKHHHTVDTSEKSLDKQLEEYWGEDR